MIAASIVVIKQIKYRNVLRLPFESLNNFTAKYSKIFESCAIFVIILILKMIIIASNSIKLIKVEKERCSTKPVTNPAIKHPSRDIATKSIFFDE